MDFTEKNFILQCIPNSNDIFYVINVHLQSGEAFRQKREDEMNVI
jgi:hypothetical protein